MMKRGHSSESLVLHLASIGVDFKNIVGMIDVLIFYLSSWSSESPEGVRVTVCVISVLITVT